MNPNGNVVPTPETQGTSLDGAVQDPETLTQPNFITKIFPQLAHLNISLKTILIPGAVVILVLMIGIGGTYTIASMMFSSPGSDAGISTISSSDLPKTTEISGLIPSPAKKTSGTSPQPSQTASVSATPTPNQVLMPTTGWPTFSFGSVFLTFKYPTGWYATAANTSGAPYMYVQNFQPAGSVPNPIGNNYTITISRLTQVGITSIDQLVTQLALNGINATYINGVNVGTVSVLSSTPTTINGYSALERTITYSASPSAQLYELYVLDGVSNAIRFFPQYNTTYGRPYFDALVSTIQFTN